MSKKLLLSVAKTILSCALFHLGLLSLYVLQTGKWEMLNVFDIVDLDLFFPELGKGVENFVISWVLVTIIIVLYYHADKKSKKN